MRPKKHRNGFRILLGACGREACEFWLQNRDMTCQSAAIHWLTNSPGPRIMKTKALSQSFLLLGVMTALAGLLTVQYGTVTFDFNTDPATSGQLQLFGNDKSMSSGGGGYAP